jgi:cell division inhibitor SulA
MKPAAFPATTTRPRHWAKRVGAAYFRMMGLTQAEAGKAVGRSMRSVRAWEAEKVTWALARQEARQCWLGELTDAARKTLLQAIRAGDGDLALKVLERTDTDLAPPTQRLHHQHEIGQGLSSLLQAVEGDDADAG